jgi:hypothetical protein
MLDCHFAMEKPIINSSSAVSESVTCAPMKKTQELCIRLLAHEDDLDEQICSNCTLESGDAVKLYLTRAEEMYCRLLVRTHPHTWEIVVEKRWLGVA